MSDIDFKRDWERLKRLLTKDDLQVGLGLVGLLEVRGGALYGATTGNFRRAKGQVKCFVTLDDWVRQGSGPIRGRFLLSFDCAETDWERMLEVVSEVVKRAERFRMEPVPATGDQQDTDGSHQFEMLVTVR